MKLTIDFETRSASPLKKVGPARYAEDPTTDVTCLALKPQGCEPVLWYPEWVRKYYGITCISDRDMWGLIAKADIIEAHNAQFEYFVWKYVMTRYGFPMLPKEKLRCSAAKAAMYGLPRSLERASEVSGVSQRKDMEGSRLMMALCKPRKAVKADMLKDPDWETRLYWRGTRDEYIRLGEYCMQDTRAEESFSERYQDLPAGELKVWQLDLDINDRGVAVDAESVKAVVSLLENHSAKMVKEFSALTGGNVSSPRQRSALLRHLAGLGVEMDALTAKDVEDILEDDNLGNTAKRLLEIRQSLSKASTAKYKAFAEAACSDNRLRGMFLYHGAGTGRWAGKIVQPHNFPRGTFGDVDICIKLLSDGDIDAVSMMYGDPMAAAASCLRGMITPAEGNEFICADFNAIEGRVLAWLAGEDTALGVYRQGRDPYKVAASSIYHTCYDDITKQERQIGKVAELALGYQGGVGAFNAMALSYGVNLPKDEVKSIVEKWRASRPETVKYWRELELCCYNAVEQAPAVYVYRGIKIAVRNGFLCIKLPSGRCLYYCNPRLIPKMMPWGDVKKVVAFDGVDSLTKKWTTQYLYGGLIAENITQAVSRDILVNGMFNAEDSGYAIVMHVHDEAVAEVPEGFGSVEEFESLLCRLPAWADGLPLKAEGWRGFRYRK